MNGLDAPIILVPQGAEERAIRRAAPRATIVAVRAGAAAAQVPSELPPGKIVVMGLCGALRAMAPGTPVVYEDVVDAAGRYIFDPDAVGTLCSRVHGSVRVHAVTAGGVVTRAAERAALAAAFGAGVVDMEGTHLARALAARGRVSFVVRIVSDDASFDLPPIADAFDAAGAIRPVRLATAFAAKPRAAARFVRDVRRALRALGETARVLTG